MSSTELDALIVEHIVDLDRAGKRIDAIEYRILSAMSERIERWTKQQGWKGEFNLPEGGGWDDWGIWFAPAEWQASGDDAEGSTGCRFEPGLLAGDTAMGRASEAWTYIARFCGVEGGQIGFRFMRPNTMKKRRWKEVVDQFRDRLPPGRFIGDSEPSFFLGFRIEQEALAAALRDNDPDAALDPLEAALSALLDAQPFFDEVVEHLRTTGS